ncbi:MAG: ethanolamine ammonia-lyase reactivating factor EutA [Kiloniellales bacterium]
MHDVEFAHVHVTPEQAAGLSETIWRADNVELTTVGIDIGSSTSHFMISRVHLQRAATGFSSRFVVVSRQEVWRSPILLTPYRSDYTIDAEALDRFLKEGFEAAGMAPDKIDSGAVILTGEALKRRNARAIAELFAADAGRFVCASAGHHLECILAAQGSGAVALSRTRAKVLLNVDIGGGTTKFALIERGEIVSTAAVAVGGRLLVCDGESRVRRLEEPAERLAKSLGLSLALGEPLEPEARRQLIRAMRDIIVALVRQDPAVGIASDLLATEPPRAGPRPEAVTFSGGVAEFLFGREKGDYGDLGPGLAHSLGHALADGALGIEVWDPGQGIRATVVGASQFTVQVSGNTILITDPARLPVNNLPVLLCRFALEAEEIVPEAIAETVKAALARHDLADGEAAVALAFRWSGTPSHGRLAALAHGLVAALPRTAGAGGTLVLLIDGDVGLTLGRILSEELKPGCDVISIDGLKLGDLDYVDIGTRIPGSGVVPVVIKSLLFPTGSA